MTALKAIGLMLAAVAILDRVARIARHMRRIRELRREARQLEAERARNDHLMAAEWLIREVRADVEANGFEWERNR